MNDIQKPPQRRGVLRRITSWFVRPGTVKVAFALLRLIAWVAKFFDLF